MKFGNKTFYFIKNVLIKGVLKVISQHFMMRTPFVSNPPRSGIISRFCTLYRSCLCSKTFENNSNQEMIKIFLKWAMINFKDVTQGKNRKQSLECFLRKRPKRSPAFIPQDRLFLTSPLCFTFYQVWSRKAEVKNAN